MNTVDYLDFELMIEKVEQQYRATVLRSPAGGARHVFSMPFGDDKLENFILKLAHTRQGTRRIGSPQVQTARELGKGLFEAVFRGEVRTSYINSQHEAKRQGRDLRLKLRLEAPELINVPWEYLYDKSRGLFVALYEGTPIVRYMQMPISEDPLSVEPPLSVLVVISSPEDQPGLDVPREQANIGAALGDLQQAGLLKVTWLEEATLQALDQCLRDGCYHIFHFMGHAFFDEHSRDGKLVLQDGAGRSEPVSGETLAYALLNHRTIRLALLNACEGARTSDDDPFAGTATTLVRTGGIPAVIAMQFPITDAAAITFTRGFYSALAEGRPVDAAVTRARLAVFYDTPEGVEWGTPVLYLRAPDGRIFDVESPVPEAMNVRVDDPDVALPPEKPRSQVDLREQCATLYAAAQGNLEAGHLPEAIDGFRSLLDLDPSHGGAAEQLARAQARLEREEAEQRARAEEQARQREIARLLAAAERAAAAADWPQAIQSLEAVLKLDEDHEEAAARLAQAREALRQQEAERERLRALASLYDRAEERMQAEDWHEAERLLRQVHQEDADYQEVATLLARVASKREEQAEREIQERLDRLYQEAQRAHQDGQWQAALNLLAEIRELDPAFPDPDGLRSSAEQSLERDARYEQGLQHLKAEEWAEALSHLEAVERLEPGYRDVAALLDQARAALPHPSIAVKLSVKPESVEAGQQAKWTMSLHNNGDEDLHDVTLDGRHLPTVEPFDLAVGRRRRFTFTTRHKQTGDRTEMVSVTGLDSSGQQVRDEASATVHVTPALPRPSIAVNLSVKPETLGRGEEARWTVIVNNDGDEGLHSVTVKGPHLPSLEPFDLAPGQSRNLTFTTSYDTSSYDSTGSFPLHGKTEKVSVTAVGTSGQRVSDETSARVSIPPLPRSLASARSRARARKSSKGQSTRATTQRTPVSPQPTVARTYLGRSTSARLKRRLPKWPDPDPAEVLRILKDFSKESKCDRFYLEPDIPAEKLQTAVKNYEVAEDIILGLLDISTRGDAKDCLLFTTRAVYCKRYPKIWPRSWRGPTLISYKNFPRIKIERSADQKSVVELSYHSIDVKPSGIPAKKVVRLLNAIKELVMQSQP